MMLMLRPDLVDGAYRELPPATWSLPARMVPGYHLRGEGRGYVGHPALGDPAFARATTAVLLDEAMELVNGLLDGRVDAADRRSPFFAVPFFRTNFWRGVAAAGMLASATAGAWLARRRREP